MSKLMIALIAGTFAATAAAQTGTIDTRTIGEHGTPAMHATESKKNFDASKAVKGLPDTKGKQQAVADATKVADHGTPVIHAADAQRNFNASKGTAKPLGTDKAAQEATKEAVKGVTK
jgi:hypothetical protein